MYNRTQSADGTDRSGQQRLVVPSTSTTQTSTADKVFLQVIGLPPTAKGAPFKFKLGLSSNFGTLLRSLPLETYRPTESPRDMPPILSWGGLALTEQMTPLSVGMRPGEHNAAIIEVSYASPSRSYFIKVSDHPQYRPPQEVPPTDVAARQHNDSRYHASSAGHSSAAAAAYSANNKDNRGYREESAASQSRPLLPYEYPRIIKAVVPHASSAPLLPYPNKDDGAPASSSIDHNHYYPNPLNYNTRGDTAAPALGTPSPASAAAISASFVVSGAKQQTRVHVRSPDRHDQGPSSVNSNTINNNTIHTNIPNKSTSANHRVASGLVSSKPAPRSTSQQSGISSRGLSSPSTTTVRQRSPSARMVDTIHQALHGGVGGGVGVGTNRLVAGGGNRVGIHDRRRPAGGGPSTTTAHQRNHSRPHVVTSAPSAAFPNNEGAPVVVVDSGMVETPRRRAGLAAPSLPRAPSLPSSSSASPIPRQSVGILHVTNDDEATTVTMQTNHSPPASNKKHATRLLSPALLPSPSSYATTVTGSKTVGIANTTLSPRQYKQRDEEKNDPLSSPLYHYASSSPRRGQHQHASSSGYFGGDLVPSSYVTAAAPPVPDLEEAGRGGNGDFVHVDSSRYDYARDNDRTSNTNTTNAAKRQASFAVTDTSNTYRAAPLSDPEQTAIYRGSGGGGDIFAEVSQSQNGDNNASTLYHYTNSSMNEGTQNNNENVIAHSSGEDPRRAAMREAVLAGQNSVLLAIASSKHADHGQGRSQEEKALLPPESSRRGEESTTHFSPQPHRINGGDNGNNGASGSSLLLLSPKQGYVAPTPFNQDVIEAEAERERRIAQLGREPLHMSGRYQQDYHGINITPSNSYHHGTVGSKNKGDAATETKGGASSSNVNANGIITKSSGGAHGSNEGRSDSPTGFTFSRVSTTHTNGPTAVLSAPDSSSADSSILLHHQPEFLSTSQQQQQQRRGWDNGNNNKFHNTVSYSSSSAAQVDPLSYTTKRLREQSEALKATLDERDAKDAIIRQLLETLQRQQEALERAAAEKQQQEQEQEEVYRHRDLQYNVKYSEDDCDDALRGRRERAQTVTDIVRGFTEETEGETNTERQYFESDSTRAPSPTASRAQEHRHNDEQKGETAAQVPKSNVASNSNINTEDLIHITKPAPVHLSNTPNTSTAAAATNPLFVTPLPPHREGLFVEQFLNSRTRDPLREALLSSGGEVAPMDTLTSSVNTTTTATNTASDQRSAQAALLPPASEDEPQPSQPSSDNIRHRHYQHYAAAAAAVPLPPHQQQQQQEDAKEGSSVLPSDGARSAYLRRMASMEKRVVGQQQPQENPLPSALSSGPTPVTVANVSSSIAVPNTNTSNVHHRVHYTQDQQQEQQGQRSASSSSSHPRVRNISTPRQGSIPRSDEYSFHSYPQQSQSHNNNTSNNTIPNKKAIATTIVPPYSPYTAQPLPLSVGMDVPPPAAGVAVVSSSLIFDPQLQALSSTRTAGVAALAGNATEIVAAGGESGGLNGVVSASDVSAKTAIASRLRQATSQLEVLKLQLLQKENELAETAARNERLARQNANGIEKLESLRRTNAELAAKLDERQQVRGTLPPSAPFAATNVGNGNPIVDYTPFSSAPVNNNAATAAFRTTGAMLGTPRPPHGAGGSGGGDFVDSFVGGYGLANVSGIIGGGNSTPLDMRRDRSSDGYRHAVVTPSSATASAQQQYQHSDHFSQSASGVMFLRPEVAPLCAQPPQEPLASSARGSVVGIGGSGGVGVGGSRGSSMARAGSSSTGAGNGGGVPSYASAPSPLTVFKSQRN